MKRKRILAVFLAMVMVISGMYLAAPVSANQTAMGSCAFYDCSELSNVDLTDSVAAIDNRTEKIVIDVQPHNVSGTFGEEVVFRTNADGDDLVYQWRYSNNGKLDNSSYKAAGDGPELSLKVTKENADKTYWCHITDKNGNEADTDSVKMIYVTEENRKVSGMSGGSLIWLLDEDGTFYYYADGVLDYYTISSWSDYKQKIKAVIFRGNVTEIDDYAFYGIFELQYVYFPKTLERIGEEAFRSTNLMALHLPNSLKRIEAGAFVETLGSQAADKEVVLPEGLEYIGNNAFYRCQLENLTVPSSVTEIGEDAFEYVSKISCESSSYAESYVKSFDKTYDKFILDSR